MLRELFDMCVVAVWYNRRLSVCVMVTKKKLEIKGFSTAVNILTILSPMEKVQREKFAHTQFRNAAD